MRKFLITSTFSACLLAPAVQAVESREDVFHETEAAAERIRQSGEQFRAELARQKELEAAQINELAAHQAASSTQEMTMEERMTHARAALAQAKAEMAREPKAFGETKKSDQDLIMEKAARAQAALQQIKQDNAPKAFE